MRQRQQARMSAERTRPQVALVLLGSMMLLASSAAWAAVDVIGPVAVTGASYNGDSSEGVTNFENAIAGRTLRLIPFTMNSTGELIVLDPPSYEGTAASNTFSEDVLFRSPRFTPENYPGLDDPHPDQVNLSGPPYDPDGEEPDYYSIFPLDSPSDPLEILFVNAEEPVWAVGLGLYVHPTRSVTVYDAEDEVVASYSHDGEEGFVFLGFVATAPEDAIARIEIDGEQTNLVDVSFVPEPGSGLAAAVALLSVFALSRTPRRRD